MVRATPGEVVHVRLPANPTTGFSWGMDANIKNECGKDAFSLVE